jgi:uncharacterized protein (TIGR00730 family)
MPAGRCPTANVGRRRATLVGVRVCVFCGSSVGFDSVHREAAVALGSQLVAAGHSLVYGGGRVGLMGALADAVIDAGGDVIGVIPRQLVDKEVAHTGLTEQRVRGSMHERKAEMVALADAFVALPGGYGTFDELFEVLTWLQLGIHAKPVVVVDVAGFFGPLFALADGAVTAGFLRQSHRDAARRAATVTDAIAMLGSPPPPPETKWIGEHPVP